MSERNATSLAKAFYHLQMAKDLFDDVRRQAANTVAAAVSRKYSERLEWIKRDFISNPALPRSEMDGFKKEINNDVLFPAAIAEKVMKLPIEVREDFEKMVDMILAGERVVMQVEEEDKNM